jgi:uncharacterized protein
MTMKWPLLVLALALGAVGAQAQTKKELVAKLIQIQQPGIEGIGRMLAGQTAQQALNAAGQALPRVAADKREAVAKDVQADVKKFHDEVEPLLRERAGKIAAPMLTPIYEERFSEEELKQLIAWLESPLSKKFAQIDRELGQTLAEKVVTETKPTIEGKLRALQETLGKRLGIPPANAAPRPASAPKK